MSYGRLPVRMVIFRRAIVQWMLISTKGEIDKVYFAMTRLSKKV